MASLRRSTSRPSTASRGLSSRFGGGGGGGPGATSVDNSALVQTAVHKWSVDSAGNIVNFDMKTLRRDILFRLQTGGNLYTLEECRSLVKAIARQVARWQETELVQLLYLTELHTKLLPSRQVVYQFPPSAVPAIPFCDGRGQFSENPLYAVTKVVEEMNRSLIRIIDEAWNNRRERMLLAARILQDLEELLPEDVTGGDNSP
jgi:hypothetical protein